MTTPIGQLPSNELISTISGNLRVIPTNNLLLGAGSNNTIQLNAVGQIGGLFSSLSSVYNTGTISISGTTVTGSGTAFTMALVSGLIKWGNQSAHIVQVTSATTLIIDASFTQSSTTYAIEYNVFNISPVGNVQAQNIYLGNPVSTSTANPLRLDMGGTFSDTAGAHAKLKLYDDNAGNVYGFGVSLNSLDYITSLSANVHSFYCDGTLSCTIGNTTVVAPTSVTTPSITTSSGNLTLNPASKINLTATNINASSILQVDSSNNITSTALTNGQLLIGNAGNNPTAATLSAGAGISITNGSGAITIAASGAGFAWTTVTGTTQAITVENGYIANNASLITFTLPVTASIGDEFEIIGLGAGGWTIHQNSGQSIQFGSAVTITGVGGSVSSFNRYDTVRVVCTVSNTTFSAITASTLTIV